MVIELSSDQSSHKVGKLCDQILNHEFPKGVLIELIISVIQVFKKDINKGIANTWQGVKLRKENRKYNYSKESKLEELQG